jgi:hypothetical protein
MQTRILVALLGGLAAAGGATAETIVVNDQVQVRESRLDVPKRGLTMDDVQKQFGAPLTRHPAVGGGAPQRPPITRWDYNGFSVFFEKDRVIDSVVTGGEAGGGQTSGADQAPGANQTPNNQSPGN